MTARKKPIKENKGCSSKEKSSLPIMDNNASNNDSAAEEIALEVDIAVSSTIEESTDGVTKETITVQADIIEDPFEELPESEKRTAEQISDIVDTVVVGTTAGLFHPHLGERVRHEKIHPQEESTPAEKKSFWQTVKKIFSRKESWFAVFGLLMTVVFVVIIIVDVSFFDRLKAWGYIGLFLISLLGSSAAVIPVPGMAVQFAMGAALPPPFGWPLWIGPIIVGIISAIAETIGAMTIYLTGYGGGVSISEATKNSAGRFAKAYNWVMRLMKKHSFIAIFLVSAVPNPFFYPVGLAAGAARIGKWKFMLFVLAGKMVKCTLFAYLGYFGLGGIMGVGES